MPGRTQWEKSGKPGLERVRVRGREKGRGQRSGGWARSLEDHKVGGQQMGGLRGVEAKS